MRRFSSTAIAFVLVLLACTALVGGCLDPHDTHVDTSIAPAR